MESKDLLYKFINDYLVDHITYTICAENYDEKDHNQHYWAYPSIYLKILEKVQLEDKTIDEMKANLCINIVREQTDNHFKQFFHDKFMKKLNMLYPLTVHNKMKQTAEKEFNKMISTIPRNKFLLHMRELEEKYFCEKL